MRSDYFLKMKGITKSPPRVNLAEILWSWVGSFLGIGAVGFLDSRCLTGTGLVLIIGSFGASAVLIFGAIRSPLAQPRNLLGGHVLSALVGVLAYKTLPTNLWVASALAVSTAIALMHATKTLHPPGGATALIAVIGGAKIHNLGYMYALIPVGAGAAIMLTVALLVNNIAETRRYPEFWL
ncbi:MAG: HPP family protein [Syntrophobacteraceae bacterium]|nr:HPP family protein [Syntrophobacteraceae bacterium]